MRLINIIVTDCETPIQEIQTFGIVDEQLSDDVAEEAEEAFIDKCVELKFGSAFVESEEADDFRDKVANQLDDGYYEIGEKTVSIVWSHIKNLQDETL